MKQTVDFYTFRQAFQSIRPDNFSAEGLSVLFDGLESLESELGEEYELDVIALCCDFAESTFTEIASDYGIPLDGFADDVTIQDIVLDYLHDETLVIGEVGDDSVIYRQF